MKTITDYATEKNTTRQTIYNAMRRNEIDFVFKYGKRLISDTQKNRDWQPNFNMKRGGK